MNIKLSLAAATLLAALSATSALAATLHGLPGGVGSNIVPDNTCKVIYMSDETAPGNDYLYKATSAFTAYTPLPVMPAADDGLGLWATKDLIFAGASPNKINVYKPCGSALGYSLTTAGYSTPLSIAVDYSRNVYATEYGTAVVDWFNPSGSDAPAAYDTPRAPGLPYYLAVDNAGNVYTAGWDPTNTFEQVDQCGPGMIGCHFCEAIPSPSWPGGMAVDGNQHLIVNNEYGSISVFAAGCGAQLSYKDYSPGSSPTHFHFTDIVLDERENAIWGDKQFDNPDTGCATTFCVDAQAEHYNALLGHVGAIAPAAHTPIITGNQPGGGIAVWPPGPI